VSERSDKPKVGTIVWRDLTVDNAEEVRNFYEEVVGWTASGCDMGGYEDYNMEAPGTSEAVGGICHRKGANGNLPAEWLIYISVADIDRSVQRVLELGGSVLDGPRSMGEYRFCVIRDPAGASAALIGP
jgi:predicted enzyme related to lactoylglutathione lyase